MQAVQTWKQRSVVHLGWSVSGRRNNSPVFGHCTMPELSHGPKRARIHKQPLKICIRCFAGSVSHRLLNAFQAAECWLHREKWFGWQFGRATLIRLWALRRLLDSASAATASANFVSAPALFKIIRVVQHRLNVQLQCVVMRCLLKFYRQPLV